nr:MAG TPA: hypothetical protein [Caudoviricetes sp.]
MRYSGRKNRLPIIRPLLGMRGRTPATAPWRICARNGVNKKGTADVGKHQRPTNERMVNSLYGS